MVIISIRECYFFLQERQEWKWFFFLLNSEFVWFHYFRFQSQNIHVYIWYPHPHPLHYSRKGIITTFCLSTEPDLKHHIYLKLSQALKTTNRLVVLTSASSTNFTFRSVIHPYYHWAVFFFFFNEASKKKKFLRYFEQCPERQTFPQLNKNQSTRWSAEFMHWVFLSFFVLSFATCGKCKIHGRSCTVGCYTTTCVCSTTMIRVSQPTQCHTLAMAALSSPLLIPIHVPFHKNI